MVLNIVLFPKMYIMEEYLYSQQMYHYYTGSTYPGQRYLPFLINQYVALRLCEKRHIQLCVWAFLAKVLIQDIFLKTLTLLCKSEVLEYLYNTIHQGAVLSFDFLRCYLHARMIMIGGNTYRISCKECLNDVMAQQNVINIFTVALSRFCRLLYQTVIMCTEKIQQN